MRKLGCDKKGQQTMGLPFSLIFAIFLIVIFIVIAFIAVRYFLDIGKCSSVGMFYDELQKEVDSVWASQESNSKLEIDLPSGITKVCFGNLTGEITETDEVLDDYDQISIYKYQDANVFLIPTAKACNMAFTSIKHINISRITEARNPYCVDVSKELSIEKGVYDKYVIIQ